MFPKTNLGLFLVFALRYNSIKSQIIITLTNTRRVVILRKYDFDC